jgi:hypothetical protein
MVLSLDGESPIAAQGVSSGVFVTNISTEISAITLALSYIEAATCHLPTLPRSLVLANNFLRALFQNEAKKKKTKKLAGNHCWRDPRFAQWEKKKKIPLLPSIICPSPGRKAQQWLKKTRKPPPPPFLNRFFSLTKSRITKASLSSLTASTPLMLVPPSPTPVMSTGLKPAQLKP